MREFINKIPLTTILITYLFVCGLLYLIAFWGTFNIDVFNLISVYDIPKSFVFPLLISQGFFLLNFMTGSIATFEDDLPNRKTFLSTKDNPNGSSKFFIHVFTNIDFLVLLFCSTLYILLDNAFYNKWYWTIATLIISFYLQYRFNNLQVVKSLIDNVLLRSYISYLLIFFPISCFSTGKYFALKIYKNQEIIKARIISPNNALNIQDTISTKFLGFISDNFIYSTLDNKKIFIINKSSVDGLTLEKE